MRLQIDASPVELKAKGERLIKTLSALLRKDAPDLAEQLEKSLPRKEPQLKYPVLRELQKQTTHAYALHLAAMLKEIGGVLDKVAKPAKPIRRPVKAVQREPVQDHTEAIADKDKKAYESVIAVLVKKGYKRSDFDKGGPLYGWSVNQLIDLAREKAAARG